jgi:hypothetical protein
VKQAKPRRQVKQVKRSTSGTAVAAGDPAHPNRLVAPGTPRQKDTVARSAPTAAPTAAPKPRRRRRAGWGGAFISAALLGWLAAAGASILLTDFVVASGIAVALGRDGTIDGSPPMGFEGAVCLFAVHFFAYLGGGYVAGRIARVFGATQGFLVWVTSVLVAGAVAGVAATGGERYNVLAALNIFPRFPVGEGDLTPAVAITVVLVVIVSLVGAVVGGVIGNTLYKRAVRRDARY